MRRAGTRIAFKAYSAVMALMWAVSTMPGRLGAPGQGGRCGLLGRGGTYPRGPYMPIEDAELTGPGRPVARAGRRPKHKPPGIAAGLIGEIADAPRRRIQKLRPPPFAPHLYMPEGAGPLPHRRDGWGLVLCEGVGSARICQGSFAGAGIAALVFDYRNFGDKRRPSRASISDPWAQIEDYHNAISYAETLPNIRKDRIGIWGISYSGGHVSGGRRDRSPGAMHRFQHPRWSTAM